MKRFAVILSVLVLAAVFLPVLSIVARPSHTPHENPAAAGESSDVILLMLFQGDVFDLMFSGKYQDARGLLGELQYANISSELQYVVDRFNALTDELLVAVDSMEDLLDKASTAMEEYSLEEARQKLEEAEIVLWDIERLQTEIQRAADTLGDRLGITNVPLTDPLLQAYDGLQELIRRLYDLTDEFERMWQTLSTGYEVKVTEELLPTQLTIKVTPLTAFIGDDVFVSGRLTSNDTPLANRQVAVFQQDEQMVFTTDENGSYAAYIDIPLSYDPSNVLETQYFPAGNDIGVYAPSKSQRVAIETIYYHTFLEMPSPGLVYPGLPVTLAGTVTSTGDVVERTVSLLLDNVHLVDMQTEDQFEVEITIPEDMPVGVHSFNAVVAPYDRYAGTSEDIDIRVSQFQVEVDMQAPSLIIIPRQVQIDGRVYVGSEVVAGASVLLALGTSSSATVETSADGSFTAILEEPFQLSLVGPQRLTVEIEPEEPYYGALEVERWVVVVNPVGVSLLVVGLVSISLLAYRRIRLRPAAVLSDMPAREPDLLREVPPVILPSRPRPELNDIRGEIRTAYLEGVWVVEKVTGTYLGPNTTLREFLRAVIDRIAVTARQPLAELTAITEMALYAVREPDEGMVADARRLASVIKKEVEGDAA